MHQPFMTVDREAEPTDESRDMLVVQSKAEARVCDQCGQPVDSGNRRSLLNGNGAETWRHAKHKEP